MLGIVRKRRAVISSIRPFSGQDGILHLVRVEYKDDCTPEAEDILWEREPHRQLLEPNALPLASDQPMPGEDFDALVRAARWSALSPYFDPDEGGPLERMPICSPFHGAVQVEDYQLVPLLKALQMPRINLMIADDVGLGKTIEAGLILRELLIRRRIQRVLILTPAALRLQWRDEMWSKFSMPFDVIDRSSTQKLRRTMGIDANPWRSSARAITSYHYLKQADVLEQFLSASRRPDDSPHLPWDMLVVDEVHNMMPAPFGEDSDLCKTLRYIAPLFEHRLFLTATPHNGRTRSFSGLLELLDPVRFTQTEELRPAEKERISQVVIRRLKREIDARTNPPKFNCWNAPSENDCAFLTQNDGEGRQLPETLRLADYGLGHDDRALEHQSVRSHFGPRFYDWQLEQSPEDSWQECHLHARNLLGPTAYQTLLDELNGNPTFAPRDSCQKNTAKPLVEQKELF